MNNSLIIILLLLSIQSTKSFRMLFCIAQVNDPQQANAEGRLNSPIKIYISSQDKETINFRTAERYGFTINDSYETRMIPYESEYSILYTNAYCESVRLKVDDHSLLIATPPNYMGRIKATQSLQLQKYEVIEVSKYTPLIKEDMNKMFVFNSEYDHLEFNFESKDCVITLTDSGSLILMI